MHDIDGYYDDNCYDDANVVNCGDNINDNNAGNDNNNFHNHNHDNNNKIMIIIILLFVATNILLTLMPDIVANVSYDHNYCDDNGWDCFKHCNHNIEKSCCKSCE